MNWDAIGAIGEIIGASAVVISLVYLGVQIRNQNRQARLDAMHEISVGYRAATATFLHDEMPRVWTQALSDYENLSEEDQMRLVVGATGVLRAWEEAFILYDSGNLEPRTWNPMTSYYTMLLGAKPITRIWDIRKEHFDDKFREYVDSRQTREYSLTES